MALSFNTLLMEVGLEPTDVRLLRHQDTINGRSIYRIWQESPPAFEDYQSRQAAAQRARFAASYWASFVAAPGNETLFVGLYRVEASINVTESHQSPVLGAAVEALITDLYSLTRLDQLSEYSGLLYIDWGDGARSWVQRADNQNKRIVEVRREIKEPDFPGYANFIAQLSEVENFPGAWAAALSAVRGIYLLTCPRTHEQYVGAATGVGGFWARWLQYARSGHGDNVALKSRDRSDYRISILEVAGSSASTDDILAMEARWKAKLQSREMGLNRN